MSSPVSTREIPGVCYDVCNNAYIAAQSGRNTALCEAGSAFQGYKTNCLNCIGQNASGSKVPVIADFVDTLAYCDRLSTLTPSTTATSQYTIPTSWLTKATTLSVTTFTGLGLNGVTTITSMTMLVDVVVTRSDWTGFSHTATTTSLPGDGTRNGNADSSSGNNNQAWIAGPVIGGVVALVALAGLYRFVATRRKNARARGKADDGWTGKPELHAESLPGPPKPPQEMDGEPRPPQELYGDHQLLTNGQSIDEKIVEMAANEVAAEEMDVKLPYQEMDAGKPPRSPQGT